MASARLRATTRQHTLSVVAASGDDLEAGLVLRFRLAARLRWELQHCRPLAGNQPRQQRGATIRKLQRVVVHVLLVFVDLAEPSDA